MKVKGDANSKTTFSNSGKTTTNNSSNSSSIPNSKLQLSSNSKTRIFGASISEVLNRKHRDFPIIPVILSMIEYIEKNGLQAEGIFRLSGSQPDIAKLKKVCYSFLFLFLFPKDIDSLESDSDQVSLIEKCKDVHVIAGLLKLYLRFVYYEERNE